MGCGVMVTRSAVNRKIDGSNPSDPAKEGLSVSADRVYLLNRFIDYLCNEGSNPSPSAIGASVNGKPPDSKPGTGGSNPSVPANARLRNW